MLPTIKFDRTKSFDLLKSHHSEIKDLQLRDLFIESPDRFEEFSIRFESILFDYSKNRITNKTRDLLIGLAEESDLKSAIELMFKGEKINETEGRAVLHTALRNPNRNGLEIDGHDILPDIHQVLDQMERFSDQVINGNWKGRTGKSIQHIVNIGIGGSDLGPVMVTEALKAYSNHIRLHFVSNVDGTHIAEVLKRSILKLLCS